MTARQRWLPFAMSAALAGPAIYACTSEGTQPPIDTSSESLPHEETTDSDSGPLDAGEDAPPTLASCFGDDAGCNSMALCGPQNFVTQVASTAPTPTGGTIVSGVYSMTSYTIYTGTNGATGHVAGSLTWQETFQLSAPSSDDAGGEEGGTLVSFTWLDVTNTSTGGTSHGSGQAVVLGTSLNLEHSCPSTSSFPTNYTATPTTLKYYFQDPSLGTAENVFELMQ